MTVAQRVIVFLPAAHSGMPEAKHIEAFTDGLAFGIEVKLDLLRRDVSGKCIVTGQHEYHPACEFPIKWKYWLSHYGQILEEKEDGRTACSPFSDIPKRGATFLQPISIGKFNVSAALVGSQPMVGKQIRGVMTDAWVRYFAYKSKRKKPYPKVLDWPHQLVIHLEEKA